MNYPIFPEFRPKAYRNGDLVQVNINGQIVPATVVRMSAGGNYWVRNERGNEILADKNDLYPAASIRNAEEQPSGGSEKTETSWENFTPDFLAEHLKSGGKAFYSPVDDPELNAPLHDTWMGNRSNLEQFVDFEAVRAGKARISYEGENAPLKPKIERFRGLSESEIRTYLQTGGSFRNFDESVKSAKPEGGFSLQEMMQDREKLATRENISAWFQYQVHQENSRVRKNTEAQNTEAQNAQNTEQASGGQAFDAVQTGLDAAGVADPTPISDGTNMVISLARAAKEPERMGEHLKNAAISGISMIPYVGDIAKGLKYGRKTAKATKTAKVSNLTSQFSDNREAAEPPTSGGGGGDQPPDGVKPTGSDPDDENIRKNLGGLKETAIDLAGAIGKGAAGAYAFAETINLANKAVIEYNRNLLKYNGELTAAYSKLDMGRLQREFDQAQKQAEPLSELIEAQNGLEQSFHDFRSDWQIVSTDIQTFLTKIATLIVQLVDIMSPVEEAWPIIKTAINIYLKLNPTTAALVNASEVQDKLRELKDNAFNQNNQHVQRLEQIMKQMADAQKRGRKV